MTAGSFRGKDKTMTALVLSLLGMAFAASAADPEPAPVETPVFGAWRNLQTESGYAPASVTWPSPCCRRPPAVTVSPFLTVRASALRRWPASLGVAALRERYHLPQAWVTDLSNGRSSARPYVPHVYAMQRVDELADYSFADAWRVQ